MQFSVEEKKYFDWLKAKVVDSPVRENYTKLIEALYSTAFVVVVNRDKNRVVDSWDLYSHFCQEHPECNKNKMPPSFCTPYCSCSILELMISLAERCEDCVSDEYDKQEPSHWFWIMIYNLKLGNMDDNRYDEFYVRNVLEEFNYRKYSKDGEGSLFYIPGCSQDLRDVEIWYQMRWYISNLLGY